MYHYSRHFVPYSRRSLNVPTFESFGAPPQAWSSGRQLLQDIDTEIFYSSRNHNHHDPFYHPPFSLPFVTGSEDSPNSISIKILPSDESPSSSPPPSPWPGSTSASPMGDQQDNHDAAVRVPPDLGCVGHDIDPFNDSQISSPATRSGPGPGHVTPYSPPSDMIAPLNSRRDPHCTFAPVQISYYPLAGGQAQPQHRQRHEPFTTQPARYNSAARDTSAASASPYSQHSSSPEHHRNHGHLSSDLLESPNWSSTTNFGSGRSLSVSQLEVTDSADSYNSGPTDGSSSGYVGSNNAQSYRHYRDHVEHDADDEGSDAMSDGIASNEGVYSSSGSDRDSFEVDSDEEYSDSDEYSDA